MPTRCPLSFGLVRSPPVVCTLGGVASSALILGLLAAFGAGDFWGRPKKSSYCEGADRESWLRQRANSWSNLAYVAAGSWALGKAVESGLQAAQAKHGPPPAQLPCLLGGLIGVSSISLGLGSFLFHASLIRIWQQADVGTMYWTMNAALAAACWRWLQVCLPGRSLRSWWLLAALLVPVAVADALMFVYKWNLSATKVFNSQLGVVIASELLLLCPIAKPLRRRNVLWGAFALATGLLGFAFRQLGVHYNKRGGGGDFCRAQGFFQPHAVWHVLTGLALLGLHALQLGPVLAAGAQGESSTPVEELPAAEEEEGPEAAKMGGGDALPAAEEQRPEAAKLGRGDA